MFCLRRLEVCAVVGIALEGGASRGAYQVGVMKALLEAGCEPGGYVGTSIGAINAAAFAQGDFEAAEEMWLRLTTEALFDADVSKLLLIGKSKWDMQYFTDVSNGLRKITEQHGIDTSRIRDIIYGFVDEDRVRASGKDFGLVTVSVTERKPYELYMEDIPQGQLLQYIEASSCVPGFIPVVIDNNTYIDGAFYNSCPVNMLIAKGYTEIIAIRTRAPGVYRYAKAPKGVTVKVITPRHNMGNVLIFDPVKIKENMERGYRDGMEAAKSL